jgi:hypothetical protein
MRALLKQGRSIVATPNLFDFQVQVLLCAFLTGSAVPHMTWLVSGYGLRSAQELGIHVRATLLHADPVERALLNRAFWCLYHIDRLNCAAIGRSVALQDTDFDADYPIAVDDEYWETGNESTNFVQPKHSGLPKVSAFIHMLKLDHVIGAALRTIYAVNKSPEHRGDPAAQRAIVVELDSALNSWADAVPDGLRWDPTRSDQQLFQQSAVLYAQYYYVQILIHRPFIPTPRNPNTVGLPSLAICSNASRSICNILDASLRRGRQYGLLPGRILDGSFLLPAWIAAIILLVSVYTGKQQPAERERILSDAKKCVAALKDLELTWRQAGKMTDMLVELLREGEPPTFPERPQGHKRPLSYSSSSVYGPGSANVDSTSRWVSPSNSSHNHNRNHNQSHNEILCGQIPGQGQVTTPPPPWEWNNNNASIPSFQNTNTNNMFSVPNANVNMGGTAVPDFNADTLSNASANGAMAMDSFFDQALFGGLTPTLGLGSTTVDGTNGTSEDDLWTQLFGTFP